MATKSKFMVLALLSAAIGTGNLAHALPPPLPLSVTVVPYLSIGDIGELHGKAAVQALAQAGWFTLSPAPSSQAEDGKSLCIGQKGRPAGCLRMHNRRDVASGGSAISIPHVYLLVQGNTHQAAVACIGGGPQASNPQAQDTIINLKAGLYGTPEERQTQLAKLGRCLLAARAESA